MKLLICLFIISCILAITSIMVIIIKFKKNKPRVEKERWGDRIWEDIVNRVPYDQSSAKLCNDITKEEIKMYGK